MKMEDATKYTARCYNGEPATCSFACPFHLDMRSFLEKAAKGRWAAAYKELRNAVVFPAIVGALCDQPCRESCQRSVTGDEAIAILEIERAVIKYAKNRKPEAYFIPPKAQKIAVVGAGVSGLSCALSLAQKKYPVTVFDKESGWGGSLREHPLFSVFDEDIALQFSSVQVEFKYDTEIKSLDELEEFDAIYVATGGDGEAFGLKDSWEPELLTTSNPKVFMGGSLCGASKMEGIAQGVELSKTLEVFLQTGKAAATHGSYDKNSCGHNLKHENAVPAPIIKAAFEDGYTETEAKQEAARCLQCDCEDCINKCEMLRHFRKKPHRMAVEVFTDSVGTTLSSRTLTREAYSCNNCGYCKSICPEQVDIGALLQMSRQARMNAGTHPAALHDYWLREMDFATSEGSYYNAPPGCEYVFYPGCQLGASKPAHVLKAYEYLKDKLGAGIFLGCCGAPAYWAGDEKRMNDNIEAIKKSWSDMGEPTFVFACATCQHIFKSFMPEIKRVSLYELLAGDDMLKPEPAFSEASVFDPCSAREDNEMQTGVRKLAEKAGTKLTELPDKNRCCGYGGHMKIANPKLYDVITKNRAEAGDKPYIVYCANCREVFGTRDKECVHILDMAFGIDSDSHVPGLQEKRDNSLMVKKELMKELSGVDFVPESHKWDHIKLIISEDTQKSMDDKLISPLELKEAIWYAESTGDKFLDEKSGTSLASLVKPVLTYWVQYKQTAPDTYEIISAYYHRMHFNEE